MKELKPFALALLVIFGLYVWAATASAAPSVTYLGNASSTALSANVFCLTADTCRTTWPSAGSNFPFTVQTYGVSTSTTIGLLNGFLSTASSTQIGDFHIMSGNVGVGTTSPFANLSVSHTAGLTGFAVGSTTATSFIVDKNGKVGIGTANPGEMLHIQGPAPLIRFTLTSGTSEGLFFQNASGDGYMTSIFTANAIIPGTVAGDIALRSNTNLLFSADGGTTAHMKLTNAGRVGIGTTTPFATLSVNNVAGTPGFVVGSSTATSFIVDKSGNVGIGTVAPESLLNTYNGNITLSGSQAANPFTLAEPADAYGVIARTSATAGGLDILGMANNTTGIPMTLEGYLGSNSPNATVPAIKFNAGKSNASTWITALGSSDTAFSFQNNGSPMMAILGSGSVGIGTTTPQGKLHVAAAFSGITPVSGLNQLVVENNNTNAFSMLSPDANLSEIVFGTPSDNFGAFLRWDYTNNLMTLTPANANASLNLGYGNASNGIRITSTGNVGVATSSPWAKFSVAGADTSTTLIGADALTGFSGNLLDLKVASTTKFSVNKNGDFVGSNATSTNATSTQLAVLGKAITIGSDTAYVTGTTTKAFNIASSTLDAMGNKFSNATSTFLLGNFPEPMTMTGFYCTASTTGTALVRFGDPAGNYTETSSCSSGSLTRVATNNSWTAYEGLTVQASSTAGQVNRITVTAVFRKDGI